MLFAAPLAFEPAAFTLESARAALQLGPVEFVCNVCGKMHITRDDSAFEQCLHRRCHMAWMQVYREYGLNRVSDAAVSLQYALRCAVGRCTDPSIANLAWASLGNLTNALFLLDCALEDGGWFSAANVSDRDSSARLLMVPEKDADAEIATCFPALLSTPVCCAGDALRRARLFAISCNGHVQTDLNAASDVLHAELHRLCKTCPEISLT